MTPMIKKNLVLILCPEWYLMVLLDLQTLKGVSNQIRFYFKDILEIRLRVIQEILLQFGWESYQKGY